MANKNEFCGHLERQLSFLRNSCDAYDSGDHDEAIRVATIARILLHDTKNSTSLLTHLDAKNINLLSTCPPREFLPTVGFFDGVCGFPSFQPKLGSSSFNGDIPLSDWWNQVTMIVSRGEQLSRSRIILSAANKDGGTHVDNRLPADYERMKQGVWTTISEYGEEKLPNHNLKALRQIGYELLNSKELVGLCM
jgi:hypothetical protein